MGTVFNQAWLRIEPEFYIIPDQRAPDYIYIHTQFQLVTAGKVEFPSYWSSHKEGGNPFILQFLQGRLKCYGLQYTGKVEMLRFTVT